MELIDSILEKSSHNILSHSFVTSWIDGSNDKKAGLIKRAIASGDLVHLRRGLYCLPQRYQRSSLNMFEVAQYIYGPSYVSLESALAYHGWIPEAVYSLTSACVKRSCVFKTPVGVFTYSCIPAQIFYQDVDRVVGEKGAVFFIAKPLRALLDYIYVYGKDWGTMAPVKESLRIDDSSLRSVHKSELRCLRGVYPSRRVEKFISVIARELGYEH
jgi:hypothetical protein